MAKAGVEVDAVVVVKGQDRVFRVGTVVVLLARVVLPVGRAGWVDPDLALANAPPLWERPNCA